MAERKGVARKAWGVLRRARLLRPRLGVLVLPASDPAGLDAVLHRLRGIAEAGLEMVVPLDGAGNAEREVVLRQAGEDWRIRTVDDEVGDAAGIAAALGSRYVVVLRADDEVLPEVLRDAVDALEESGRGWAIGPPSRTAAVGCAVWPRTLLADLGAAAAVGVLPAAALSADDSPLVLPRPLSSKRPAPSSRGRDRRTELAATIEAGRTGLGMVPGAWRARWAASAVTELAAFLDEAERYDEGQWELLHRWAPRLVEAASEEFAAVPVETRVKAWLAARDRRADLVDMVEARRLEHGQFATRTLDGVVTAVLPVAGVPEPLLALAESETTLRLAARRLWLDADELRLRLFAYIGGIDLSAETPEARVFLVEESGARIEVPATVSADREVTRFAGTRYVNYDRGVVDVVVPVATAMDGTRWRVGVTLRVAGVERTGIVEEQDRTGSIGAFVPLLSGGRVLRVVGGPFALVVEPGSASPRPSGPVLNDIRLDAETLTVSTSDPGQLRLSGPAGLTRRRAAGAVSWELRHAPWDLGDRPAPVGRYVLTAEDDGPVALAPTLAARLPETVLTEHHRAVVSVEEVVPMNGGAGHRLVVELGPPLADDELGPYCQRRLQEWYAAPARGLDESLVYLQAYTGASATDSPRAIADELARVRPDLRQVWAVADAGSYVPEGAETVLWRSRAWYAALASAGHVVTNIELEAWFRRRPGQRVLQTFHGYPSKAMGIGLWESKGFTPSRIERMLDRTSRNWTLLLTPSPEMDVHYRENYRYDGEILSAGYPRDDALVGADDEARAAARARLGIAADSIVVLYAPTWRDEEAIAARRAPMVDHLDIAATAADLGPAYTLLLRGHRFMRVPPVRASGARVLDVSGYPEIDDLILAADVAVLDYTSMRFDIALTGIPMIFLVPDLERYAGGRGFLYPFAPTASGPLLRDRADVVAALRDLDAVRSRYAAEYDRFNRAYNAYQDGHAARRTVERFFEPPSR